MSEYLSLYDYLGKPAGIELGKEVKTYADEHDIPFQTREVSTPNYKGTVCLYPEKFLDHYFRIPDSNDLLDEIKEDLKWGDSDFGDPLDYDLPF